MKKERAYALWATSWLNPRKWLVDSFDDWAIARAEQKRLNKEAGSLGLTFFARRLY